MDNQPKIVMYSTQWCGDCVRSKKVFDKLGIAFTEVDIDYDKDCLLYTSPSPRDS